MSLKTIFFDVDGVLLDSLPQHLPICRDKAAEFGLDLKIPTVETFRRLVHRGTEVSPMLKPGGRHPPLILKQEIDGQRSHESN
jgi:beta-phosphoglucomutase-like phosphatase (HAD superfamily)